MKDAQNTRIQMLARNFLEGSTSEEEARELNNWYQTGLDAPLHIPADFASSDEALRDRIYAGIKRINRKKQKLRLRRFLAAAAILLACVSLSIYIYQMETQRPAQEEAVVAEDIKPAADVAVLILSDGSRIALNVNADLTQQAGMDISSTAEGELLYKVKPPKAGKGLSDELNYHTIETPIGGKLQLQLADGSRIWLNAESSLRYPVSFADASERTVMLNKGEAYFDVAKSDKQPFHVLSDKQRIEVMGTKFNVNVYPEEGGTKTTLLSGSVKIVDKRTKKDVFLKAGQQALLTSEGFQVSMLAKKDPEVWKDGKFIFDNEPMSSIMRQVERWYQVRVVFADSVQDVRLSGSVSRFQNISTLLEKFEQTGLVIIERQGKNLTVRKPVR